MGRLTTLAAALALAVAWAGGAEAAASGGGGPEAAAKAWAAARGQDVIDVKIGRGDVDGDGVRDAVALVSTHAGGASGAYLTVLFLRGGAGGSYQVAWTKEQAVGAEPRNIKVSRGAVEWDGTFWKPTDPHCCPTGKQRYREAIPVSAPAEGEEPLQGGDRDKQAKAAFMKYIRANAPERYRAEDVLARLTGVQMALQRAPEGSTRAAESAGPAITVRAGLDQKTLPSPQQMTCWLYEGVAADVPFRWVGCRQSDGSWLYGNYGG